MAGAVTFLLLGFLLKGALCNQFKVTLPETVVALRGSCVTVSCSFDIGSTYKNDLDHTCIAKWKSTDEIAYSGVDGKLTRKITKTGDLQTKDCTTTFNNMELGDTSYYFFRLECKNERLKWSFKDASVNIQVKAQPPSPTLTPPTLVEREGTSVSLKCSAPALCLSHPPMLTWTPMDMSPDSQETLQENQDKTKVMTSVLTFTASHLHDGRTITCTATYNKQRGAVSTDSTSLTASVSYPPKSTTVSVSPSGPVPDTSSVTLMCTSAANPAVRRYTWFRADGGQDTSIGTGQTLTIKASELTAPVFCEAENPLGAGRSNITHIDVQYSPKSTTVSVSPSGPVPDTSSVTLTCTSAANPAVRRYTWFRADGGQDTSIGTGQTLTIKASELTAPVFCEAENRLGAGRSNITHIDVQYSPRNHTVSVSPSGPVPDNSSVTLTCTSAANPAVRRYTWFRADGGQDTSIGPGQTLTIKASELTAPVFCEAENHLGAGRSNITHIDVQYSPKSITVSVSPSGPVPDNSNVTLMCTCAANPAVRRYTWFRADGGQDTSIGTGQTLTIKASELTAPVFCEAENPLGAGRSNITHIDVQFRVTLPVFVITVVTILASVCVLLLVIRVWRTHSKPPTSECTVDTTAFAVDHLLARNDTNEAPNTTEEHIYSNTDHLRQADITQTATTSEQNSTNLPSSGPSSGEEDNTISEKKNKAESVVYSTVNFKRSKKKKEDDSENMVLPGTSYLEEERCIVGEMGTSFVRQALEMSLYESVEPQNERGSVKNVECEYAQVKFKNRKKTSE